jgi:hypothetical protein
MSNNSSENWRSAVAYPSHTIASSDLTRGQKRPVSTLHKPSSRETSVEQDTRSVALDLGLLSLNSESRQVHYLGSSSGSLFASLVQARKTEDRDKDVPSTESSTGIDKSRHNKWPLDPQNLEDVRKAVNSLYDQLRKVWTAKPWQRLKSLTQGLSGSSNSHGLWCPVEAIFPSHAS